MAEQLLTGEQIREQGFNPDTKSSIGGKFYLSQFTGGGSSNSSSNNQSSQEDTIRRAIQMQQEANQPAIQSLQAQIPEQQKAIETRQSQLQAETTPLTERYNNLISTITNTGKRLEEQQTRITSGEMGKRGLLGSSTLAQQELQNAITPITEKYTGMATDAGLDRESALRDLASQITNLGLSGTEQQRAITNAIAQLQAGAGSQGIQTGLAQQQAQTQQSQFNAQQAFQQSQAEKDREWQKLLYNTIQLPESKYTTNAPYYKPDSPTGDGGWE